VPPLAVTNLPADEKISQQRIYSPRHRPPENEVPVAIATPHVLWRTEGTVMAVPSVLIYTTGVWLLALFRTPEKQSRTPEQVAALSNALRGLTVNGRAVELLGGEHGDHGFTYSAWVQFPEGSFRTGIAFNLEWPGIQPEEHHVNGLVEARSKVTILWTKSTG
jgi:hypothetical protein